MATFAIGIDLGQRSDRTALSIVEEVPQLLHGAKNVYHCRHLQVWNPGTQHTQIIDDVSGMLALAPDLAANVRVVLDITATGQFVAQEFMQRLKVENVNTYACTITSGLQGTTETRNDLRVPKRDLVGMLRVLLENKRLQIAPGLQHGDDLIKELSNFKLEKIAVDDNAPDWRVRPHDDLVLATALACWLHEAVPTGATLEQLASLFNYLD